MPWSYPDNVPDSMKYFKPSIQKKAISIANAILKNGGQEGTAIATGIKKSKGLIKLAYIKIKNEAASYIIPTLIGAGIGVNVGRVFDKGEKHKGARIGGLIGAVGGATAHYNVLKNFKQNYKRYNFSPPSPKPKSTDIQAFFKEYGHDYTNIKTKLQAKKVYYEVARKHHPDMGGSVEKFKKLSTDWEGVKNSGWFDKLAMIRDGKFLKEFVKQLRKGNQKYLVDNYDKLVEKVQEPIL